MYHGFYGLTELPFELTPNPRFLFLTARHREALSNLHYALAAGKGLTLLVGEAGTGKTTLLQTVFTSDECRHVRWVCLNNPLLTRDEFVRALAARFGLHGRASESKSAFLDELEAALYERRARGERSVLVVDEAQSLSAELLEEIRLLANIETASEKLLLVMLAGQPELSSRLNDPALRQLKQRIALRCEIAPFDLAETAAYIDSRVRTAGGESSRLFTRAAVRAVPEYARGIPRTINVICDTALVGGFAAGRQPVDRHIVLDVTADFDLAPNRDFSAWPGDRDGEPLEPAGGAPPGGGQSRQLFEQITRPRRFAF